MPTIGRLGFMQNNLSRVLLVGLSVSALLITAEVCGWIGLSVQAGHIATYDSIKEKLSSIQGVQSKNNQDAQNGARVIHPYLGFATPPQTNTTLHRKNGEPLEEYGFDVGSGPLMMEPDPTKHVIGIFGGSVAKQLWEKHGTDALITTLKTSPAFKDKEIIISSGAFYSYRQPQDFLSFAYLLSLGAHFDTVILLDGFNDIFRPPAENMNGPISPLYPYGWAAYTGDLGNDPVFRLKFGKVALLDDLRFTRAQKLLHSPLRFSMAASFLWHILDTRVQAQSLIAEYELQDYASGTGSYAMRGPKIVYESREAYWNDRTAVWKKSAESMWHLAASENMQFFHFLQPNQYVPDSKPIHPDEAALMNALPETGEPTIRQEVEAGYPYLQRAGEELRNGGVHFYDLTSIFSQEKNALYVDPCCHLNEEGNAILGKKIGELMLQNLASPSQ